LNLRIIEEIWECHFYIFNIDILGNSGW